jgi:diacylglycerol O-acyltransferase
MQQLSFIDSAFLMQESPRTPNHLCMVGLYDPSTAPNGAPTFEQILGKVEACLAVAPSLRRKLVRVPLGFDRPYWVEDPDFDIEFHMRHLALPRPGDWRQFCVQVARLHARPIDLSRPPWEMTVIDGLDSIEQFPEGSFGTVLKVHHSAIDGVSGVELLGAIHDREPNPEVSPVDDGWRSETLPSTRWLLRRAAIHAATNPINAGRLVVSSAPPLARELVGKVWNRPPALRVPRTRFNQKISAHRVFDEARCSLDDLKLVKATVPGATVNDACLSIVGGAMRRYLVSLGELPEESLVTLVPVSTRTPEEAGTGGNQVSMMRVSMHTDIADPLGRLAAIRDTTAEKKAAQRGVAIPALLDIAQAVPGALIGAAVRAMASFGDRGPVLANTILTNVPGPPAPLYFLGAKLVRSTGCVPLVDGVGLFHCVSSYSGIFTFMITACRDLLPDPAPYIECLDASIDEHLWAAGRSRMLSTVETAESSVNVGADLPTTPTLSHGRP